MLVTLIAVIKVIKIKRIQHALPAKSFDELLLLTYIRPILQSNKKSQLIYNADQVTEVYISVALMCNRLIKA